MLDIGDLLDGKYRLQRQLGQGGMGTVYKALHEQINKPVAVKVLLPQDGAKGELVARFHREAQAAASAGHRGIVDIYDVGVCNDGAPFLVMELLQGEDLGDLIEKRGRLDVAFTAYVVCHVLSALSAAHGAGVVHRDLKPDNIFLVESGASLPEVKLLDFGISRVIVPGSVTRMTRSGAVMGTPHYMSPEQSAGKSDIDHRTDLFSIGVILYECLTGELPFDADNYNALLVKIISEEPAPPRELVGEIPPSVETTILRALQKSRAERYQDAAEVFSDLQEFVDSGAIATLRVPRALAGSVPSTHKELRSPPVAAEAARSAEEEAPTAAKPLPETNYYPAPSSPPSEIPSSSNRRPLALQILGVLAIIVVVGVIAGLIASKTLGEPAGGGDGVADDERGDSASRTSLVNEPTPVTVDAGLSPTVELDVTDGGNGLAGGEGRVNGKVRAKALSTSRPTRTKAPAPSAEAGVAEAPATPDYGTELDQPEPRPGPEAAERPRRGGEGSALRERPNPVREKTPPNPPDYGDELD